MIDRQDLIELLKATIDELERNASFEGRLQYTCMLDECEGGKFAVRAFVRANNDMGQGSCMVVDGDVLMDAPPEMLRDQVLAFHKKFGQAIGEKPHVPDDETIRFRLGLIAEEFFELLAAAGARHDPDFPDFAKKTISACARLGRNGPNTKLDVDLPEFVDAMADLDYVVEGTRITMGVNGIPIAAEVQRANMDKIPAVTGDRYDGTGAEMPRPTKPKGWRPPDIEGELKKQSHEIR